MDLRTSKLSKASGRFLQVNCGAPNRMPSTQKLASTKLKSMATVHTLIRVVNKHFSHLDQFIFRNKLYISCRVHETLKLKQKHQQPT